MTNTKMIQAAEEAVAFAKCAHELKLLPPPETPVRQTMTRWMCVKCEAIIWIPRKG